MPYHELLKKYIADSRLSLSEISEKLSAMGINTDKSHLSKLQNGKLPPASDQMNRALAAVTGGNLEDLLAAAVIAKAPDELKESWERLFHLKELSTQYFEAHEKVETAAQRKNDAENKLKSLHNELKDLMTDPSNLLRIPVVREIQSDDGILKHIESWQVMVNEDDFDENELFYFRVPNNHLISDRIRKGDLVLVKMSSDIDEGIAVVNIDGEKAALRKIKKINGNYLVLSDDLHESTVLPEKRIRICGKVIRVVFEL